jgi:hypothetical protein
MHRGAFACFVIVGMLLTAAADAAAQSYQRYSDGLVSIHARKVVDEGQQPTAFVVCAQRSRPEPVCPIEIRLNFRGASETLLGQVSAVLLPEVGAPVCRTVDLPAQARSLTRWEIARFRCHRPEAGRASTVFPPEGG